MKLSDVRVDASRGEMGDWVTEIPDMGDLALKVRAIGNSDWRQLAAKMHQAIPRAKRMAGRIDLEEADRITNECLLQHGLMDWKNVEGDGGKPIAYSKDAARKFLTDPDYRMFRDAVMWACGEVDRARTDAREEAAKN